MLKTGATNTRKHRCAGVYVWYSIRQDPQSDGANLWEDRSEWEDRSPNWQRLMTTAIGDSGTVERKKMRKLIGEDSRTLHPNLVKACEEDLRAFEEKELANSKVL